MTHKTYFLMLLGLMGACGGTEVATDRPQGPVIAKFEGRLIDLSQDWDEARACLIWREAGIAECYRTEDALNLREIELDDSTSSQSAGTHPLDHTVLDGRVNLYWNSSYNQPDTSSGLKAAHLADRYCQNLRDFGMGDQVSSQKNRTSTTAHLWWDADCNNPHLDLPAGSSYPHLRDYGWNDEASSVSRN